MVSRLNSFIKLALAPMLAMTILVGCNDQIRDRSTISPASSKTKGGTTGGDGGNEPPTTSKRPTNAIFFKSDFCGCKDGKPVTFGNCSAFCSNRDTDGKEILYASFTVTEDISLNSGLGNVHAWCSTALPGEEDVPKCVLEVKDEEQNKTYIDVTPITGANSVTSVIDSIPYDKTYVITLVEQTSGARSNSVQIQKYSSDLPTSVLGPLKNAPISQYTCLVRKFLTDDSNDDLYFQTAYRLHFYFLPSIPPQPITPGTSDLICHDIFNPLYGAVDDALYPRLEHVPGVFNLWDATDPRFYNNNSVEGMDVNEIILQKAKNFGGTNLPTAINFFLEFKWPGSPQVSEDAGNNTATQALGYYMAPWIDQSTYKSYCLNSTHYNSSNPLFKAMRDVIGVDTEGLYVGVKPPETVVINGTTTAGDPDYILIRETDLKKVWFYLKNGVPTVPTDAVVASVPVYFYYPLNTASPFVKSSTQRTYQVKGAKELSNVQSGASNTSGTTTSYPPHDRKIGCIPKF